MGRLCFAYDGLGRLRTDIEYSWNGSAWVWNSTTEYLYDGTRVIQERDVNNNPTANYTRGTDLSGSLEGAGGIGGLLARSSGSQHYYYHADGNGNITCLENSSQSVSATYRYDPFGNLVSSSGIAGINPYRFSSKQIHANSAMYIYLYRWYDPNLQRWLNRDPLGEEGGLNLYAFVRNDPINKVDPFGLKCDWSKVGSWFKRTMAAGGAALATLGGGELYYAWKGQASSNQAYNDAANMLNRKFGDGPNGFDWPEWAQDYMRDWRASNLQQLYKTTKTTSETVPGTVRSGPVDNPAR